MRFTAKRLKARGEHLIKRAIRALFRLVFFVAGLFLLLLAGVGGLTDKTQTGRAIAIGLGVVAALLLLISYRLRKTAKPTTTVLTSTVTDFVSTTENDFHDVKLDTENPFKQVLFDDDGNLCVKYSCATTADSAIKELRLLKRMLVVQKRDATNKAKEIRAGYTDHVRRRGSKLVGGGGFGRFIRAVQTASRDGDRRKLAESLAPIESAKQRIDRTVVEIDAKILEINHYIDSRKE